MIVNIQDAAGSAESPSLKLFSEMSLIVGVEAFPLFLPNRGVVVCLVFLLFKCTCWR